MLALILFVGVTDGYAYLSGGGEGSEYYAAAATPIGQQAAALAGQGRRVLCIVTRDASVVKLLTHNREDRVRIAEFYDRPLDPGQLPLNDFRPEVLLIENAPAFRDFAARFPAAARTGEDERFTAIGIPAQ